MSWLEHVKETMKKHPGKQLKEVLKEAKKTYKKVGSVAKYAVTGKKEHGKKEHSKKEHSKKHSKSKRKTGKKSKQTGGKKMRYNKSRKSTRRSRK